MLLFRGITLEKRPAGHPQPTCGDPEAPSLPDPRALRGRLSFRGARWFTNKAPCGPKRGHGTPQPRFGLEVQLDKIAVELGISPAKLRRQNLVEPNSLTANWMRIGSMGLGTCIDKVVAGSRFEERWSKLPYGKGLGIACSSYLSGAGLPIYWNAMPHSGVQLKLDRSGLVRRNDVAVLTVSMDPWLDQQRWCDASGVMHHMTLSDYPDERFGHTYGLLVKETGYLARSVLVIDRDGVIRYIETQQEMSRMPDLAAAEAVARRLARE